MRVLSLFDGISVARQALQILGHTPEIYYASEIDKYSISVAVNNFHDIFEVGNIENLTASRVGKIDLLIGGSPCQDLSIAKKDRQGLEGKRSGLFWHYVRILETVNPKYFVLENVASMKKTERDKISEILGVEPIMINSALLTAQQRKRYYWTNIPNIQQPEDKHIYLKDILESEVEKKYILSDKEIAYMNRKTSKDRTHWDFGYIQDSTKDKSQCLTANLYKGVPYNVLLDNPDRIGKIKGLSDGQANRIYSVYGKSVCLSSQSGGSGAKTGLYCVAMRGRHLIDGKRKDITGAKTEQQLEPRFDGKTNCLTTVQKDNMVLYIVPPKDMDNFIFNEIADENIIDIIVRKLTPLECERLQGLPDNFTKFGINDENISNTQRYKMIGNSFTAPVIAHILSSIPELSK